MYVVVFGGVVWSCVCVLGVANVCNSRDRSEMQPRLQIDKN